MTDDDQDQYDDDWYDDEPSYAKEEPNCDHCGDSRYTDARFGRSRPCPACSPTRLDNLRADLRWRWWRLRKRMAALRPGRDRITFHDDEVPF